MIPFRVARRILLLAMHVVIGMLLTPIVLTRHPDGSLRTNPTVTSWWHNRLADILSVRITVTGQRPAAPSLLVSNHVSWLDIIILGGLTHTDFLSKYEVRRWPVIGWLADRSGTLFIRRGSGDSQRVNDEIAARLRNGGLMTLFPEGTTTDGSTVRPFFSRLFAAALDSGTAVVPVALRYHVDGDHDPVAPYTDAQSLADNLRGLLVRQHTQVHVTFCASVDVSGLTRKQVAEQARSAITASLQRPIAIIGDRRLPATALI